MNLKISITLMILIMSASSIFANGADWGGQTSSSFLDKWTIGIHAGFTSYYGDVSLHDRNFINKLQFESKPAYGVIATKHLNNYFGLGGQMVFGGFKSDFTNRHQFQTDFLEYNLQARVQITDLIFPYNNSKFSLSGFAGIGQFFFKVTEISYTGEQLTEKVHHTGVPEFVLFFGGGVSYRVTDRIKFNAELALKQAQNDKLDNLVKNGDFDYYTHLSFGVSFFIPSFSKPGKVHNLIRSDVSYQWR